MTWTTGSFFKAGDDSYVEYYVVPTGKDSFKAKTNEQYQVCILASGYCPHKLIEGVDNDVIQAPIMSNVDAFSETDLDEFDNAGGQQIRDKLYRRYFPGFREPGKVFPKKQVWIFKFHTWIFIFYAIFQRYYNFVVDIY